METNYQVMYRVSLVLSVNGNSYNVPTSDIMSITIIHNYDGMTFPIIRVRLYCELSLIQNIVEYPDEIEMVGNLEGNVYRLNSDQSKPMVVDGATPIKFNLKAYIENKNIPTSVMDQYRNGKKITTDMNQAPKATIELYGYNQSLVYYLKRQVESIYHNMGLTSIIQNMMGHNRITNYTMSPLNQQSCFDQILIPNLNLMQALAFFDTYYGLYEKGCSVYGDLDKLYICNASSSISDEKNSSILIKKASSESDMVGLQKYNGSYMMNVLYNNISLLSESDIERLMQAKNIGAINVNTNEIQSANLQELYQYKTNEIFGDDNIPSILHKYVNPFIASSNAARIKEKITKVDMSFTGFDIGSINVGHRFTLTFDDAIRGRNLNGSFRPIFANHVIINQDDDLFIASTSIQLCQN